MNMTLAEFVLWAALQVGVATPTTVIYDLPGTIVGQTYCDILATGPMCDVTIDPEEARRDTGRMGPYTPVQHTVMHEMCHIKVFMDWVDEGFSIGAISRKRHHGRPWIKCARDHLVRTRNYERNGT